MTLVVEQSLIERARAGGDALNALIETIWPEVYRVAIGIVRDRAAAEDAAQEACASIARTLPSLKRSDAFYGWMYRIAGRCAVDAEKRRRRHAHGELPELPTRDERDAQIDLHAALLALPLAQRSAVVLHYYAGLTSAEIARALGVPSPTVRFYLMLARRTLRERLAVEIIGGTEACERA